MQSKSEKDINKYDFVTSGVIVVCLFLYAIFPANNIFQQIVSSLTFLLVIPFLYVKIILKKSVKDFGIQKGNFLTGLVWSVLSLFIAFLIVYILFHYFNFSEKYSVPESVRDNFIFFVGYEVFLAGFFVALYEIFFRGFLMFSFEKKIGYWSILLQAVTFFLLIWLSSSLDWSIVPYLIFALFGGTIAFYSRSVVYSFVSGLLFYVIVDSIFIKIIR